MKERSHGEVVREAPIRQAVALVADDILVCHLSGPLCLKTTRAGTQSGKTDLRPNENTAIHFSRVMERVQRSVAGNGTCRKTAKL
jgi:hypothetical protein